MNDDLFKRVKHWLFVDALLILKGLALFTLGLSCQQSRSIHSEAVLLKATTLTYPSGSALVLSRDTLYLMGDDARDLMVLDTAFNELKRIPILSGRPIRLSKKTKADIESAVFLNANKNKLLLLGSGSVSPVRDSLFIVNLPNNHVTRLRMNDAFRSLLNKNKADLNIEGAAWVDGLMLLANRGHQKSKQNYVLVVEGSFATPPDSLHRLIPLMVPDTALGVSGLDYIKKKDLLVLTFSSEATSSSYTDGTIGNSALGLIGNISQKLRNRSLMVDVWIPLASVSNQLNKMKIESVAVSEDGKKGLLLYLVADNDDGQSTLFKVRYR